MKMKKSILALTIINTVFSYANNYVAVVSSNDIIHQLENRYEEWSEWVNVNTPYNCNNWSPLTESIDYGVDFIQSRTCEQDQEQYRDVYEVFASGKENIIDTETNSKTINIVENQNNIGTRKAREMCINILNRGNSIGNGIYSVDVDGSGAIPPRNAYCDMTGGGWTLYDTFGSKLVLTGQNNPVAYNANNINSGASLTSGGYTFHAGSLNSSTYHVSPYYLQFFESGSPVGWIQKTMPNWIQSVRVDASNEWYDGNDNIFYNSVQKNISAYRTHDSYIYNAGGSKILKLEEDGILWVDSIWVK